MPKLIVIPEIQDGELLKYLTPGQELQKEIGLIEVIGCLPRGMVSGLPTFNAVIKMPDGTRIIAETSWRNMGVGVAGLIGRWGTP